MNIFSKGRLAHPWGSETKPKFDLINSKLQKQSNWHILLTYCHNKKVLANYFQIKNVSDMKHQLAVSFVYVLSGSWPAYTQLIAGG